MKEKIKIIQGRRSILGKRYLAKKGGKTSFFDLYQPALNLSQEEYGKRWAEIKKRGGPG